MPKKKKTPKNSFYFFMKDFKEEQEQMGYVFKNGLQEVAVMADPEWKTLSPERRMHYENMAADHKLREKGNKFTTMGVPYSHLEKEKLEKMEADRKMRMEIEGTVQGLDREGTLRTHVFYFVHFNYYCQLDDGQYLVCEVAVAQFNLLHGVKDVYHTIIRQERIPTGYTYAAVKTLTETHQIPVPNELTEGEPLRGNIFSRIKQFLEQNRMANGYLPPLYSHDEHVGVAQNVLSEMAEFHYPQNPDIFRVYPLSKLFFFVRNAAVPPNGTGFPVETLALRELEKDQYNFAPGIACEFHKKDHDTSQYCSRSIVTRWGYLICDHCCPDLRIPLVHGRHVPNNAAVMQEDQFTRSQMARSGRALPFVPASAPEPVSRAQAASAASNQRLGAAVSSRPLEVVDYGRSGLSEDSAHVREEFITASVQDALHFTSEDFPDLGSRSHSRMPAAVAGRGRGRARIIQEEKYGINNKAYQILDQMETNYDCTVLAPGDLIEETENLTIQSTAGRGRSRADIKPGSRLAANFQLI
ncbi:Protein maelstrom homolog [Gryllus bimaculatus]|nr:Protein maelstrom homolog [Gryllus bimaculatus]